MSGKRRKYTPEFREQAARLVIETGRPVAHVAAEIGVGDQVLGRWVRLQRQAASAVAQPARPFGHDHRLKRAVAVPRHRESPWVLCTPVYFAPVG
ncbi:transposase [Mycobacterium heckeshornense]|uniref:Uncharacterized protein n=1 Tax=Mycobacterium heckeshornense TaxID=110505 RepID=A0A2I3EFD4_9MYCO|nr:transposase [Mycobacterium heckeshornense]KMV16453.1 hypothetical protein ACT16_22400 [Mycobacterium heckeshornense]BCO36409.1 hypothetical protein MHEC_28420 [Mycobacterium heckeshornense]